MPINISTYTNYDDDDSDSVWVEKIQWFSVQANLFDTEKEKQEKIEAMRYQWLNGIIYSNGIPVGMPHPNITEEWIKEDERKKREFIRQTTNQKLFGESKRKRAKRKQKRER